MTVDSPSKPKQPMCGRCKLARSVRRSDNFWITMFILIVGAIIFGAVWVWVGGCVSFPKPQGVNTTSVDPPIEMPFYTDPSVGSSIGIAAASALGAWWLATRRKEKK